VLAPMRGGCNHGNQREVGSLASTANRASRPTKTRQDHPQPPLGAWPNPCFLLAGKSLILLRQFRGRGPAQKHLILGKPYHRMPAQHQAFMRTEIPALAMAEIDEQRKGQNPQKVAGP